MQERQADAVRELSLTEALSFANLLERAKHMSKSEAFDLLHAAEHSGHIFAVLGWTVEDARSILGDYAIGVTDEALAEFLSNNSKYIEEAMSNAVNEVLDFMWEQDNPDANLVDNQHTHEPDCPKCGDAVAKDATLTVCYEREVRE